MRKKFGIERKVLIGIFSKANTILFSIFSFVFLFFQVNDFPIISDLLNRCKGNFWLVFIIFAIYELSVLLISAAYCLFTKNSILTEISGEIEFNFDIGKTKAAIPEIFEIYKDNIFLIGPNMHYLLGIGQYHEKIISENDRFKPINNFVKMITSIAKPLIQEENGVKVTRKKRVRILIADINPDSKVGKVYREMSPHSYQSECEQIRKFIETQSIDRIIKTYTSESIYQTIADEKLLEIRYAKNFYLESFCFVDQSLSGTKKLGGTSAFGYFRIVLPKIQGMLRPIFYLNSKTKENADLLNKLFMNYYDLFARNENSIVLWPTSINQ